MKILHVIHGYPIRYNAGSEVYTQTLCQSLSERHEVHVFSREEDPFLPDFHLRTEQDHDDSQITIHLVNNPRNKDRYRVIGIDQRFSEVLDGVRPDVVHVGHLNHLSTSLLSEATRRGIPIVYTLHDYWLMCPRGQFMQISSSDPKNLWAACEGQEHRKCAEHCYARYFGGTPSERDYDIDYWEGWVTRRMKHVKEVAELVDIFIAPSRYLYQRYRDDFGLPESKLIFLDYGFDHKRLSGRVRKSREPFTFGYIGTHIPAKGIHDLLHAFGNLRGQAQLRVWGRTRGQDSAALKRIAEELPSGADARVKWLPEYRNQDIVQDVFNHVDAIVVPSVWVENSPLVIHEAQQVRVPVITANVGGMAEYVHHEVNGLQFKHRSRLSLACQMQRFIDDPDLARQLGEHGYLHSTTGDIIAIQDHVHEIERIYKEVFIKYNSTRQDFSNGPWRITFDTNPDTCNMRCIMCEEHSPHSPLQSLRKAKSMPHRLMPIALIRQVVAEGAKHGLREIIPSTMGEPLLYEHFSDIIDVCSEYGIQLNLTTNGTFPRLGAQAWARQIVPVTSDVKISWNGATKKTQESIMLGSQWDKVLKNVETFISIRDAHAAAGGNRCRVTLQLTFLEANVSELADIVRLAIRLGVDRVKGHHLWAHFDEIKGQSMRRNSESITRWNTAVIEAREAVLERRLPNGDYILLENIFPLDKNATGDLAPGGSCPFLRKEAWIGTDGQFSPCCAPDAQRRTLGDFGNVNDSGMMGIWQGKTYQHLASTYRNQPLCVSCNMRAPLESTL